MGSFASDENQLSAHARARLQRQAAAHHLWRTYQLHWMAYFPTLTVTSIFQSVQVLTSSHTAPPFASPQTKDIMNAEKLLEFATFDNNNDDIIGASEPQDVMGALKKFFTHGL